MMRTMNNKFWILRTLSLFIVLALNVLFISACGKTGMPQPEDPKRNFTIAAAAATSDGRCLYFDGQLEGSYENLEAIKLELQSVNGPDDCPQCPFVPNEIVTLPLSDLMLDRNNGSISFSYCPHAAIAYRWRILGISKYSSIPHAISYESTTMMDPEANKVREEGAEKIEIKF